MSENRILIKNGTAVVLNKCQRVDILIENKKIARIASGIAAEEGMTVIDAKGKYITYGLADVHVHFREPGYSAKETIETGSKAAAHGGYTTVCCMPNLNPAPDSLQNLDIEEELIDNQAVIDVRPYATITKQRKGMEAVDFETLSPYVVGFSDDGSGVQNEAVMEEAMTHVAALKGIIAAHCEDNSLLNGGYIHEGKYAQLHHHRGICSESEWGQIKRDITLAEKTGCHYHVCHISTKESVELIRKAKARGVNITCETAPHYLVLTDEDLQEDGRFKMNPPLRSAEDQYALIEGIKDGTIDCIATDHAPHTPEEKSKGLEKSAMGIVGLETAFSVVYTHLVKKNVISFEKMLELMCDNPRRIFNLKGKLEEGEFADLAIFDIDHPYTIDSSGFFSKGHSTPFEGWRVYGKCCQTIYHGKCVWKELVRSDK